MLMIEEMEAVVAPSDDDAAMGLVVGLFLVWFVCC